MERSSYIGNTMREQAVPRLPKHRTPAPGVSGNLVLRWGLATSVCLVSVSSRLKGILLPIVRENRRASDAERQSFVTSPLIHFE